jgi:hypothetical protein
MYPESTQATTALVLAILHFVVCPVLGPVGWWMANQEIAAINGGRRPPENLSTANAARIVGIIGTVLLALGLVVAVIGMAMLFIGGGFAWFDLNDFR